MAAKFGLKTFKKATAGGVTKENNKTRLKMGIVGKPLKITEGIFF